MLQDYKISERLIRHIPAGNCMLKVNNKNTRTRWEICSLVSIVDFEYGISGWDWITQDSTTLQINQSINQIKVALETNGKIC